MKIRNIKKTARSTSVQNGKSADSCSETVNGKASPVSGCCSTSRPVSQDKPPCCGPATSITGGEITEKVPGFIKWLDTPAGRVAQISTTLSSTDHWGACKARWAINRMNYIVPAGLYAIGTPGPDAPVIVTANYKMSYDILRHTLVNRDLWLLVLETFGINVWCAAGKGSFGTDELVSRINRTELHSVVSHRELTLPILGAPGVSAHQVAKRTGFTVRYATIRADDLPEYLDNAMTTTAAMREMTFSIYERLVLLPVEILLTLKSIVLFGGTLVLAALLTNSLSAAVMVFTAYLGAVLSGVAVTPILLPWIPGRSFAFKGALVGGVWSALFYLLASGSNWHMTTTIAAFLALPAISAFYALNFTGCTVYTSRSGVKKEMRLGIPAMGIAIAISVVLLIVGAIS